MTCTDGKIILNNDVLLQYEDMTDEKGNLLQQYENALVYAIDNTNECKDSYPYSVYCDLKDGTTIYIDDIGRTYLALKRWED